MDLWIKDPTTKLPSVSLSMLSVSFVGLIIVSILQLQNKVESTSAFTELFYTCGALYFGRRLSFNNKTYNGSTEEKKEEVVND